MKKFFISLLLSLVLISCSSSSKKKNSSEDDSPPNDNGNEEGPENGENQPEGPANYELPPPPYENDEDGEAMNDNPIAVPITPVSGTNNIAQPPPPLVPAIDVTPMAVDNGMGSLSDFPQPAIDADGNAFVVWANQTDTLNALARRYDIQSRTWGSPVTLGSGAIGSVPQFPNPQIAALPTGEALAIWRQRETPEAEVNLRGSHYAPSDNSWTVGPLLDGLPGRIFQPQIDSDENGRAFFVWRQLEPGSVSGIYAAGYNAGWNETAPDDPLDSTLGRIENPRLDVSTNGNAAAVWEERPNTVAGSKYNISLIHYTATTDSLSVPVVLDDPALDFNARNPRVAMAENGDAYVVWQQEDGGGVYSIYGRARYLSDGSLSAIWSVVRASVIVRDPQIIQSGNQILVAYLQVDGATVSLMVRKITLQPGADAVWDEPIALNPTTTSVGRYHLVNNAVGKAVAVWEQLDPACTLPAPCGSIFMNTYDGTSWSGATAAESDNAINAQFPRVALNADGNGLIVWTARNDAAITVQTRGILIP